MWGNGSPAPNMKRGSVAFWRKETNIIFALFSLAEDHCHALPYLNLLVYGEERCGEEGEGEGGIYMQCGLARGKFMSVKK
jgi:hypothetical protein